MGKSMHACTCVSESLHASVHALPTWGQVGDAWAAQGPRCLQPPHHLHHVRGGLHRAWGGGMGGGGHTGGEGHRGACLHMDGRCFAAWVRKVKGQESRVRGQKSGQKNRVLGPHPGMKPHPHATKNKERKQCHHVCADHQQQPNTLRPQALSLSHTHPRLPPKPPLTTSAAPLTLFPAPPHSPGGPSSHTCITCSRVREGSGPDRAAYSMSDLVCGHEQGRWRVS